MKRIFLSAAILCAFAFAAQGQSHSAKVHVHVVLVDAEFNQKPIPFLNVVFLKGDKTSFDVKTGLDGAAEIALPAGTYTVTTAKPVEFAGKRYSWSLRVAIAGAEKSVDLTNDNAKQEENSAAAAVSSSGNSGASNGDLTQHFKKLKNTVVTVISESGHGTGFFVDGKGLILTNQHVVGQSQYLAVQFDREHKITAKLIASEYCAEVTQDAFRIHGGYGYSKEYEIERLMREAPFLLIGEGTSEIQKSIISRGLLREYRSKS